MNKTDLAHAKKFLIAVHKAMDNTKALVDSVRDHDHDDDGPPLLCTDYCSYRRAIDPEKFEKLNDLVYFLCEALFGEDCDADSIVLFNLVHLGIHENIISRFRVPRVDDEAPLEERYKAYEVAQNNIDIAQARVNSMKRILDEDLQMLIRKDSRLTRAEDCSNCCGKGWVKDIKKNCDNTEYKVYCGNWTIGADRKGPNYRRLCSECQTGRPIPGGPK